MVYILSECADAEEDDAKTTMLTTTSRMTTPKKKQSEMMQTNGPKRFDNDPIQSKML